MLFDQVCRKAARALVISVFTFQGLLLMGTSCGDGHLETQRLSSLTLRNYLKMVRRH